MHDRHFYYISKWKAKPGILYFILINKSIRNLYYHSNLKSSCIYNMDYSYKELKIYNLQFDLYNWIYY
jgi:hypothetical protein